MNVPTITMPQSKAREAYAVYLKAVRARHTAEDEACRKLYLELARGHSVIDIREAFTATGANESGWPKLAIAPANERQVRYRHYGGGLFWCGTDGARARPARSIQLPPGTLPQIKRWELKAVVPSIPPQFRPAGDLSKYWILWEAAWEAVPVDPFLLKRLTRWQFAILAQWDLTEVERMVLRDRATEAT